MLSARLNRRRTGSDDATSSRQNVQRPSGKVVQGIAAGIGLAAEAFYHHKEKKALRAKERDEARLVASADSGEGEHSEEASQDMIEASWQLDEAQEQLGQQSPPPYTLSEEQPSQLADSFLQAHPMPPTFHSHPADLALPVLLTQRRPGKRSRGFVRAYAPLLNDVGIDQATFLDFVDDLNKAVQPSGLIQALNLASLAGLAVPEPFTILISAAIQVATNMGDEVHSRMKTNKFLDQINESFFKPRGLIALLMTWKPSRADEMMTTVDLDMQTSIVTGSSSHQTDSSLQRFQHKFDQSSGATSFEFPETAPLIFPALDDMAIGDTERSEELQKKKSALKRSGNFVQEYMDKRARAEWAGKNPESKLANAGPKEEFHSRYADPNHPASSGDPLALLTGGHLQRGGQGGLLGRSLGAARSRSGTSGSGGSDASHRALGRERLARSLRARTRGFSSQDPQGRQNRPEPHDIYDGRIRRRGQMGRRPVGNGIGGMGLGGLSLISGAKNLLQHDILYLMIVQRPTDEQLAEATVLLS